MFYWERQKSFLSRGDGIKCCYKNFRRAWDLRQGRPAKNYLVLVAYSKKSRIIRSFEVVLLACLDLPPRHT